MKLIVGLGNPGPRYADTRHNIGRRVVGAFADAHDISLDQSRYSGVFGHGRVSDDDVALLLPDTYMNLSGEAVVSALAELDEVDPARDLILVYDDLDLPFARIRIRSGGGAGGQKGVAHIIETLDRRDFTRLRFGIGRPARGKPVVDYVLDGFGADERETLPAMIARAVGALDAVLEEGAEAAMSRYNADPSSGGGQASVVESRQPAPPPPSPEAPIVGGQNLISRILGWFRLSKK